MKNGKHKKPPHCIHPECKHERYARGLCCGHYQAAYKRVQRSKGKVTWTLLEKYGAALPVVKSWFDEVLERAERT